jgi:ABC-2 type transport system ATP-binding protein
MSVIRTASLTKRYKQVEALKVVSIEVKRGQIYGLLGRNGAGKTTLVKILLGIVKPTAGQAELLGQPAGTVSVRRQIGYLPEDHRFPEYHTGWSLLDFYGALLGVSRSERRQRIPKYLEMVGIAHRMHSKIRTFSKGMKQRLGIAQALMHEPEVLFLDEPTDGVDPVGRREIREILLKLKHAGKTIFLNSHLLSEVEMICDRVAFLELGLVAREGDIDTLTRQKGCFVLGLAEQETFPLGEAEKLGYHVQFVGQAHWEVALSDGQSIDPIIDLLHTRRLHLRHLVEKRQTLEDIFMATVDAEAVEAV